MYQTIIVPNSVFIKTIITICKNFGKVLHNILILVIFINWYNDCCTIIRNKRITNIPSKRHISNELIKGSLVIHLRNLLIKINYDLGE